MKRKETVTQCVGFIDEEDLEHRCGLIEINGDWIQHPLARIYPHKTHGLCPECYEKSIAVLDQEYNLKYKNLTMMRYKNGR